MSNIKFKLPAFIEYGIIVDPINMDENTLKVTDFITKAIIIMIKTDISENIII